MRINWTTLGEYIRVQGGYAYKSKDFRDGNGKPVLKIKNVRFGVIDYSDTAYIDRALALKTKEWQTYEGDILISMTGSGPNAPQSLVGRVARVWKGDPDAWINQRVGRILVEPDTLHKDFVFYFLSQKTSQDFLVANSSGSANQANISAKTIEMLPCPKLGYAESERISKVLKALDEKIILNRQTNQTLESMAQALFKSWFVDFDPVIDNALAAGNEIPEPLAAKATARRALQEQGSDKGNQSLTLPEHIHQLFPSRFQFTEELGWIPEGWDSTSVDKATYVNPRVSLKKGDIAKYVDMKALPTRGYGVDGIIQKAYSGGAKFEQGDVLLARITPCLENGKTGIVDFLEEGEVGFGSTEFIVLRPKGDLTMPFVACLARDNDFRSHCIQSMVGSSGRQRVQNSSFSDYFLALPTDSEVLQLFNQIVKTPFERMTTNNKESSALTALRDTLLPKLLSGELRIPDATNKLDEAFA